MTHIHLLRIFSFLLLQDPMNTTYGFMFTRPETCLPWIKTVSQVIYLISWLFLMLIKCFFCVFFLCDDP